MPVIINSRAIGHNVGVVQQTIDQTLNKNSNNAIANKPVAENLIFDENTKTFIKVGSLNKDSNISGKNIKEVLTDILCYAPWTITFTGGTTGYIDKTLNNYTINQSITLTKGSVARSNTIKWKIGDGAWQEKETTENNFQISSSQIPNIDKTLTVQVISANSGESLVTSSKTFKSIYPMYYGCVNLNSDFNNLNLDNLTKIVLPKGTQVCTYNTNGQYLYPIFMYPSSYGNLKSIKDSNGFSLTFDKIEIKNTYNNIDYIIYYLGNNSNGFNGIETFTYTF